MRNESIDWGHIVVFSIDIARHQWFPYTEISAKPCSDQMTKTGSNAEKYRGP